MPIQDDTTRTPELAETGTQGDAESRTGWRKQPDQELAIGGLLEQWLRTDSSNGYVTKVPHRDYCARWAVGFGANMTMVERYEPTLGAAQSLIERETVK